MINTHSHYIVRWFNKKVQSFSHLVQMFPTQTLVRLTGCHMMGTWSRTSRPEVFCKKGDLRNFAKFSRKHPCQSLFFSKVVGLRPATLLKIRLWHRCFPVNFAKFLRTPLLTEHLRWLLMVVPLNLYSLSRN